MASTRSETSRCSPAQTLQAWYAKQRPGTPGLRRQVLLWPDTFTNHLNPGIGRAAVAVLSEAGYEVLDAEPSRCAAG